MFDLVKYIGAILAIPLGVIVISDFVEEKFGISWEIPFTIILVVLLLVFVIYGYFKYRNFFIGLKHISSLRQISEDVHDIKERLKMDKKGAVNWVIVLAIVLVILVVLYSCRSGGWCPF